MAVTSHVYAVTYIQSQTEIQICNVLSVLCKHRQLIQSECPGYGKPKERQSLSESFDIKRGCLNIRSCRINSLVFVCADQRKPSTEAISEYKSSKFVPRSCFFKCVPHQTYWEQIDLDTN